MLTEYDGRGDRVTAVLTSHTESGENFDGAIAVGFYPGSTEVWVQLAGERVNVQAEDIDGLCKQLKRAKKLAQEHADEPLS